MVISNQSGVGRGLIHADVLPLINERMNQLLRDEAGASVDYFALAAIVAFALTGHPPFGDGDAETIVARQISGKFDASEFAPSIGVWLTRALSQNADDRFTDAAEMKEAWRVAVRVARRRDRAAWWRRNSPRPRA